MAGEVRYRLARFLSTEAEREIGSPRIAALVRRWHGFGTRAELVARVGDGLCADERTLVFATLDRFVARGVLVSEAELRESLLRADTSEPAAPLVALVVPTRAADAGVDALAILRRGLESHARDRAAAERGHEIAVFDDGAGDGCRSALGELAASVRLVGRREKHELATALLAELGGDESVAEAVRFAMFGSDDVAFRAGANRNCALLLYAGERFASIDDDGVCRISAIPGARSQVRLSSAPDPTEFWCFDDREALLRATAADREDLVGLHGQLLGRTVAGCVAGDASEHVDLDDMSPRFTERILSGRARVAATYLGVAGDSGMASPAFALLQRGASRQRIVAGPDAYARALRGREVVRGVTAPTLVDSGFFMGLAIGLDHRDLLPPFLPVGRGEDHMFGLLLAHGCSDAVVGCLPWAVMHAPPLVRTFTAADLCFRETKLADLLRACIHGWPAAPIELDRREGLRALGRRFMALASGPAQVFAAELAHRRAHVARSTCAFLDMLVRRHQGEPAAWRRDVERYAATCEAAARDEAPIVADECSTPDDPRRGHERTRDLVRRVGELLVVWPEIVDAARAVRCA